MSPVYIPMNQSLPIALHKPILTDFGGILCVRWRYGHNEQEYGNHYLSVHLFPHLYESPTEMVCG